MQWIGKHCPNCLCTKRFWSIDNGVFECERCRYKIYKKNNI